MKKIFLKALSILFTATLFISNFTMFTVATDRQESAHQIAAYENDFSFSTEELESMFLDKLFYGEQAVASFYSITGADILTGESLRIYKQLQAHIQNVSVNGGSTAFLIHAGDPYLAQFTGKTHEEAAQKLFDNFANITRYVLRENPENFYWMQLASLFQMSYGYYTSGADFHSFTDVHFYFEVDPSYRADGYSVQNPVIDNAKMKRATDAKLNAQKIAAEISAISCTDTQKLYLIKEKICELVQYDDNHAASQTNDPWQIVHAFDLDPSTSIVCEGYAKAFQYLCDLIFPYGEPACYCVSGKMGTGNHMWNIVVIAGQSFFVDVTNCDTGTAGCGIDEQDQSIPGNRLFMLNMNDSRVEILNENGYKISTGSVFNSSGYGYGTKTIEYTYDVDTLDLYSSTGCLSLSMKTPQYIAYDFNENGAFDISDYNDLVFYVQKGDQALSQNAFYAADKNRDNALDAFDIALMNEQLAQ